MLLSRQPTMVSKDAQAVARDGSKTAQDTTC